MLIKITGTAPNVAPLTRWYTADTSALTIANIVSEFKWFGWSVHAETVSRPDYPIYVQPY
jgi:hypothetical protein